MNRVPQQHWVPQQPWVLRQPRMPEPQEPQTNLIWWIHPGKLLLFFLVPIYAFVMFVVPNAWPELIVLKGGMYAKGTAAYMGLAVVTAVGVFGMIGAQVEIDSPDTGAFDEVPPRLLVTFGVLTILAYMIWFYPAVSHGFSVDRSNLNQTPGVTSFSQLGVPFVVTYLSSRLLTGQTFTRLVRFEFWTILFLTVMRVQLWSERLAMIEVGIPIAVLLFTHRLPRSSGGRSFYKLVGAFGPFLAIPILLAVFTITEFFRSWSVYSQTQSLPLFDFMTSRLVTYYFTAINNGAGMLATQEARWPTFDFYYTFEWLYHLPLGIGDAVEGLSNNAAARNEFLLQYADVEFNNMSGIYPIFYDMGYVLGFLYFCWFGFVAGVLYRSMIHGRTLGMLFYPSVFVGCLEVMRETYLNGSRVVLIMFGCTVAYLAIRTRRAAAIRRERFPRPMRPMWRG